MQALRPAGTASAKAAGKRLVKKTSQRLPPLAAKKVKKIFRRGAYLAENTSQTASVEFVPHGGGTNYARSRLPKFVGKAFRAFRQSQRKRQIAASFFVYSPTKSFRMGVKMSSSTPFSRQVQPCSMPFSFSSVSPARTTLVSPPMVNWNAPLTT